MGRIVVFLLGMLTMFLITKFTGFGG